MVVVDERSIAGYFELDEGNGAGRRGVYLWRVATGALVALCLGLPLFGLWDGVQAHQWQHLRGVAQFPLYVMIFLPWAIGMGWFPWRTVSAAIGRLWRAAAEGDEALAPLAETQPKPISGYERIVASEVLAPLRGIKDGLRVRTYWALGILFLVFGLFVGVLSLYIGHELLAYASEYGDSANMLLVDALTLALAALPLLFYGIRWPIVARRIGRGLSVTVDETGLTWRDTRWHSGMRRIVWSEIEAFVTIMCKGSGEPPTRVYALKAGGTTLLWSVKAFIPRQEHVASERFCRLIVTRTGLSLRDLTAISRVAVDEFIRVAWPRGTRRGVPVAQTTDALVLLDAILPHDFIADAVGKARRGQLVAVWLSLPYTVVLLVSTVAPWFQGRH